MNTTETGSFCADCGRAFTEDNPAVRYLGRIICREDFTAAVGGAAGTARVGTPGTAPEEDHGEGAAGFVRAYAWFHLIASIFVGIWIFANYGTTVVPSPTFGPPTYVSDPTIIGLSVLLVVQGIFSCALFIAIASMTENLAAIRRNTSR